MALNPTARLILIVILTFLNLFILIPGFLILAVLSIFYWTVAVTLAQIFKPNASEIYRDFGVLFCPETAHTKPAIAICVHNICKGSLALNKLRRLFQQRVIDHPEKRYRHLEQVWTSFLGYYFWQWDRNFSVKNHIRAYDYTEKKLRLPNICTEEDLERITGPLLLKPFAKGRSAWEILLISNYKRNKGDKGENNGKEMGSVLVLRFHHALADGFSIIKLMLRLFDHEDMKLTTANFPRLNPFQKMAYNLTVAFRAPFDIAVLIVDLYGGTAGGKEADKPGKLCTLFSDSVPVDRIKKISKKHQVNYNAVVYSVTAGAYGRLMEDAGLELPPTVPCFVPFPMPNHPGGLVNNMSSYTYKFSPGLRDGPTRLRQVSVDIKAASVMTTVPIVLNWMVELGTFMPVVLVRLIQNRLPIAVGMSSVPGPPVLFAATGSATGIEVITAVGPVPGKMGSFAMMVSMAGNQRFVLTANEHLFGGLRVLKKFREYVREELNAL